VHNIIPVRTVVLEPRYQVLVLTLNRVASLRTQQYGTVVWVSAFKLIRDYSDCTGTVKIDRTTRTCIKNSFDFESWIVGSFAHVVPVPGTYTIYVRLTHFFIHSSISASHLINKEISALLQSVRYLVPGTGSK
jgi:hypothetical protein